MRINYPTEKYKGEENQNLRFNSKFGKYLVGEENTWHGGIHIEGEGTPIQAIADGRVIAYRFTNDYKTVDKTENLVKTGNTSTSNNSATGKYKYSNCFVLIQHDFEIAKNVYENKGLENETVTQEKEYVTFYSLYNHLLPINQVEENSKLDIASFLGKQETKIKQSVQDGYEYKYQGLNARYRGNGSGIGGIKTVIPFGEKVDIRYDDDGKEIKKGRYINVSYVDDEGVEHTDIYIHTDDKYSKKVDKQYEIVFFKDVKAWPRGHVHTEKGIRLRHAKAYHKNSMITQIIPVNTEVTVKEIQSNWYILDDYEGFLDKSNFNTSTFFDDTKGKREEIVRCNIPIKAGDHIGYPGLKESEVSKEDYYVCHHETFMDNDNHAKRFLNDDFGAGKEIRKYGLLPEETELIQKIIVPIENLTKKTPVKIIAKKGNYYKVKVLDKLTRTIHKKGVWTKKKAQHYRGLGHQVYNETDGYSIVDFDYVNKEFDMMLTKGESKIFHEGEEKHTLLKVSSPFKTDHKDKEFWVKISDLSENYNYKTVPYFDYIYKSIRKARSLKARLAMLQEQSDACEILEFITDNAVPLSAALLHKETVKDSETVDTYDVEKETEITKKIPFDCVKLAGKSTYVNGTNSKFKHIRRSGYYPATPTFFDNFRELNRIFEGKLDIVKITPLFRANPFECKVSGVEHRRVTLVHKEITKEKIVPNIIKDDGSVIEAIIPVDVYRKIQNKPPLTYKDPIKITYGTDNFAILNAFFENKFPATTLSLIWVKMCNDKGERRTSESSATHRVLRFDRKAFEQEQDELNEKANRVRIENSKPKKGEEVTLVKDVEEVYLALPDNETDLDYTFQKEGIVKIISDGDKKITKDGEDYIEVETYDLTIYQNRLTKKGWIKESLLKEEDRFSPFNWMKFKFNPITISNEYFFAIKGILDYNTTESEFIKKVWESFDFNDDDIIDADEVRLAYKILETQKELSKIVAKNKSEWSYKKGDLVPDIKKFYESQITKKENQKPKPSQEIINKMKALMDKKIGILETQIEDLMFWEEASGDDISTLHPDTIIEETETPNATTQEIGEGNQNTDTVTEQTAINTPEETTVPKPKRMFPSAEVHHFHPIAFINHMNLIFNNASGPCPRCNEDFTEEQLKVIRPNASSSLVKDIVRELNEVREEYKINTCQKKAHLMGQFVAETDFNTLVESLNYSTADRIKEIFGKYFTKKSGNKAENYVNQPKKLANLVYAKKNGNEGGDDGWNYRGRGLIQLTGKGNYKAVNDVFKEKYPNLGDIVDNPELLEDPKIAVLASLAYWENKELNKIAEREGGVKQVDNITKIVNKYTGGDSKANRREGYEMGKIAFKLFECELLKTDEDSDEVCTSCNMQHIDLTLNTPFQRQRSGKGCKATCDRIVKNMGLGLTVEGGTSGYKRQGETTKLVTCKFQLLDENSNRNDFDLNPQKITEGMSYLNKALEEGYPIVVGVNHTFKYRKHGVINDDTTDHYVLIIGRYCENGKTYYPYYDVGTSTGNMKKNYRFELQADNTLVNDKSMGNSDTRKYTVSQIRRIKKSGTYVSF